MTPNLKMRIISSTTKVISKEIRRNHKRQLINKLPYQ